MNQETMNSSNVVPDLEGDKLFGQSRESRTTDLSPPLPDCADDGAQVHDDELLTEDDEFVMRDPFAPHREPTFVPRMSEPYREHSANDFGGASDQPTRNRRDAGPPPLPPPFALGPLPAPTLPGNPGPDSTPRSIKRDEFPTERPPRSHRAIPPAPHQEPLHDPRRQQRTLRRNSNSEFDAPSRGGSSERSANMERRRTLRRETLREGDLFLDKFRVDQVVNEGLVVTANAIHLSVGSRARVVMLVPHARGFGEAQDYFVRAGRAVAHMQSEHVARVLEMGVLESGAPFIVTELSGYADLAELLRVRGPLSVTDAVDYTIHIAEALAEAHALGIIHGNLRPSNLVVCEGIDGTPLIKVLGFGALAQWTLSSISLGMASHRNPAVTSGALPYLSPEQIRSLGDVDFRSDIWSLGTLLYEMLVGVPVFQGDSAAALLATIAADPAPCVTATIGDVPRQLETIISRCLEKNPDARYASLSELARVLQQFGSHESRAVAERIVRITARGSVSPSVYGRPTHALVHIPSRHQSDSARSHAASPSRRTPAPPPAPSMRMAIVAGAVVLLGAAAGVAGALFATQALRPTQAMSAARDLPQREPSAVQKPSARLESAPATVDNQRVETALPRIGSPNLEVQALHAAAIASSAGQTPAPKAATPIRNAGAPTRVAPSNHKPVFEPPPTLEVKVTRAVEPKRPSATGNSLFDDIN